MADNSAQALTAKGPAPKALDGGRDRVGTFDLLNGFRFTGAMLILAFISFAIGGILPVAGEKGNKGESKCH